VGTVLGVLATVESVGANNHARDPLSISSIALSQLFSTLPSNLPVYGLQIYALSHGSTEIALLTATEGNGWQIRIYGYDRNGKFISNWVSPQLDPEFAVSSADNFRRVFANVQREGPDIEFRGCKVHDCPGSFGVLLYSPSRKKAFQAVVRNGETVLSPELSLPENKPLKDYLLKRVEYESHYHE
jgi:hypothetical protein